MEKTARVISCNGDPQAVCLGLAIELMNTLRDAHKEKWAQENYLKFEDESVFDCMYSFVFSWTIKEVPIV